MNHTPAQVSKIIGISVQSVRNWTREYAPLLSSTARGENGPRIFDDNDLDTLRTIAALRNSGLPPSEIIVRMQDSSIPPIVDISPQALQSSPQSADNVALALHVAHNALQSRLDSLENRLDAQASERQTRLGMFALGVVAGVFLVLVLIIVANQLLGAG